MTADPIGPTSAASEVPSQFETFDLTVSLGPGSVPWLSASSCAGFVHGVPRGGGTLPDLQTLLDLVYDYTDAVQFAEPDPEPELSRLLGELVFGDPMVRQLFVSTRGVAADRGRQTLVRILASPHLAALPWELLPDPMAPPGGQGHKYLALAPDAHVVRMARGRTYPSRGAWLEPPLNLLIVLSSPTPQDETEDWLAFDIFEVKRNLLTELAPLQQAGLLSVDIEDRPTLENLRRRIGAQRRGYHLFHYVGHALPDRLVLEDRAGRREDLPSARLVELLRLSPDLRLALFAGCETARAPGDPSALDTHTAVGWRDLLSLSDYCVQEACPTVVGMQAVLPFATERVFTRFFYQGLATGYPIAEALRLARGAIQSDDRSAAGPFPRRTSPLGDEVRGGLLDWSVPALFTGSNEPGALLQRMTQIGTPRPKRRVDLRLGLAQRTERFFSRDLALRQAVDVMGGLTRERVLVVTGPVGVGKTSLVDRALEELGEAVTHALYVHFDRLSPEIAAACKSIRNGSPIDLDALAAMPPDVAVERLCRCADELLRLGERGGRPRDPAWTPSEWWERLVEDLVVHRPVIAIDETGLVDRLEQLLLDALVRRWFVQVVGRRLRKSASDQVRADLELLLRLLQAFEERGGPPPAELNRSLDALNRVIAGVPGRVMQGAPRALRLLTEEFMTLADPTLPMADSVKGFASRQSPDIDPAPAIAALCAIDRVRTGLGACLKLLADRRSAARIVISAEEAPRGFIDLPAEEVFEMRLAQISWPETWRWIRRNLSGLVSFGEDYLSRLWARLGTRLDLWEELERRAIRMRGSAIDLEKIAGEIGVPASTAPADPTRLRRPRGERPLRIAVAGPFLAGPAALAESMTRLAVEQGIGGRVVYGAAGDAGALATLVDVPTPFEHGSARASDILKWLYEVSAQQPDIILLDYGSTVGRAALEAAHPTAERTMLRGLHHRCLLIAAGGNDTNPGTYTVPGAYPEVLGIGALDNDGVLRGYSLWRAEIRKPDLFIADDLSATSLSLAIKPEQIEQHLQSGMWGSSYASLHAVAAAALVWAVLPDLSPQGVRELLLGAATPIGEKTPAPQGLTIADAVAAARRRVVERTLAAGPCSRETLAAITGLDLHAATTTLRGLVADGRVRQLVTGRLERYQLVRTGGA